MDIQSVPLATVVLPTFNRQAVLRRAIASVLGQTMRNYELIVVDDGSTDNTLDILNKISDPRLKLISHATNLGAAAARNSAIHAARGKYIAFIDSDDEWLPEKLAIQTAFLEAQPSQYLGSCTRHFVSLGIDAPSWRRMLPLQMDWQRYLLSHGCDLSPGSTLMVHRSAFERVGLLDTDLRRYEDWDWLLRYLDYYELGIVPETLAVIHLSTAPPSEHIAQSMDIFMPRWTKAAKKHGWGASLRFRSRFYMELAKSQILEGKRRAGIFNVARCMALWPFQRPTSAVALVRYLSGRSRYAFSSRKRQ